MNNEFKQIAKRLGIAIPACLLSIGVVKAESTNENVLLKSGNAAVSVISESGLTNNAVIKFLTADFTKGMDKLSPDHTNYHSNTGGDHADQHSNTPHANSHTNVDARNTNNSCIPHTDNHSNSGSINSHTNHGNKKHTDAHTNKTYAPNC